MWDSRLTSSVETIKGDGDRDRWIEEEAPPSVQINPHSELGKELRKWEQHHSELTPRGTHPGNPYVYREYPKMLYKAERHPETGQPTCQAARPNPWAFVHIPDREARAQFYDEACQQAERWSKEHQKIVHDEAGERLAKGQGWAKTPAAALEQFEQEQQAIAEAAANTAYLAQRMSEQARAELKAADAETDQHVVDVQPTKRGRTPKAVTGSGPVEA